MGEVSDYRVDGHTAVITLNRPDRLNALSPDLRDELTEALAAVRADDNVRAAILTGAGRGFCSGADLSGFGGSDAAPSQNELLDEYGWVGRQAMSVYRLDKPVIAAVNGVAAGAGMSLSLSCDMRIGSENSSVQVGVHRAQPVAGLRTEFLSAESSGSVARGGHHLYQPSG